MQFHVLQCRPRFGTNPAPIIMPIKANLAVLVLSGLAAYAGSTKENTVKETALRVLGIRSLGVARCNNL
jgi:hypothetical protein